MTDGILGATNDQTDHSARNNHHRGGARHATFLPPLPWNDLVESPFRLGRVAWRYTPRIRQSVGRSRLSACAQVLSPPFFPSPLPPLVSAPTLLAAPVIRDKSQFRAQHDSLSLSLR